MVSQACQQEVRGQPKFPKLTALIPVVRKMSDNCYKAKRKGQTRDEYVEQENRLTNRHIQALSLMQDIHRENEELKKQLKQMEEELINCKEYHEIAKDATAFKKKAQEDCLKKIDQNAEKLNKKHKEEVMSLVSAKLQAETEWLEERDRLQNLLDKQEKQIGTLTDQLETLRKHDLKIDVVNQRLDQSLKEMIELKQTNKTLHHQIEHLEENEHSHAAEHLAKVHQIQGEKDAMTIELQEVQQRLREFELRVKVLEGELSVIGEQQTKDRQSAKSQMRHQLDESIMEIKTYQKNILDLEEMVSGLKKELQERTGQFEQETLTKNKLLIFLQQLQEECKRLKEELAQKQQGPQERVGFREFVQMRRELNVLKDENDLLKQSRKKPVSLPSLKGPSPESYMEKLPSKSPGKSKSETSIQFYKR